MRALIATLFLLAVPVGAGATEEADTAAAREHFRAGQAFYIAGNYSAALHDFEAALMLKPIADFYYNIGLCQERLNQPADAIESYRAYVRAAKDPAAIAEAQQRIARLQTTLPPPPANAPPSVVAQDTRLVAAPVEPPRSFALPVAFAVGAVALAAVGVALVVPVYHEYDGVSKSWDRQPTPQLASQADYLKTRFEAGYAVLGVAGVAAIVDVILWARTNRGRRDGIAPPTPSADAGRARVVSASPFHFSGTF